MRTVDRDRLQVFREMKRVPRKKEKKKMSRDEKVKGIYGVGV
jgi:hypothetical protein